MSEYNRWEKVAKNAKHKPSPYYHDVIPDELYNLGEVFFPIPPRKKGWNYLHHLDENRYYADDEILNAYLESGWSYGIACDGDLAVIDVDELEWLDAIISKLPPTLWQRTGSREGVHLFYIVPGLDSRITLNVKNAVCDVDDKSSRWRHIGEVKCDPHGYVLGPGSSHPSGNIYGPLKGDSIATISKNELEDIVEPFTKDEPTSKHYRNGTTHTEDIDASVHNLYEIEPDDVLPYLDEGARVPHPVHGSDTGANFMKNDDNETFTCWRHQYGRGDGCGLNATQYLAVEASGMDCDDVRRYWHRDSSLHYKAWKKAVEEGIIKSFNPPYRVVHGYAVDNELVDANDKLTGELYFTLEQELEYYTIQYLIQDNFC